MCFLKELIVNKKSLVKMFVSSSQRNHQTSSSDYENNEINPNQQTSQKSVINNEGNLKAAVPPSLLFEGYSNSVASDDSRYLNSRHTDEKWKYLLVFMYTEPSIMFYSNVFLMVSWYVICREICALTVE